MLSTSIDPETLPLPRILCLHGGGVNARTFRLQCRVIIHHLQPYFRLVFVDAPFICKPHEDITAVYGSYAPFYRWLRWEDDHAEIEAPEASRRVISQCRKAMEADPGTGEWVGVLGFSQGAKIAASLLWAQEKAQDWPVEAHPLPGVNFRFGVLMAGSAPVVILDSTGKVPISRYVDDAGQRSLTHTDWPESAEGEHVVTIPTLHVHGLLDPGIDRHRMLLNKYCKPGTTRLVEWEGPHRIPIKKPDVDMVVTQMLDLARQTGVWHE